MSLNPTQLQARNSLVLVQLFLKADEKVGHLLVPTDTSEYAEAEVISVGPDPVQAAGGTPSTFDLKPGMRVLVKHKQRHERPAGQNQVAVHLTNTGIPLRHTQDKDGKYYLFDQTCILAVIGKSPRPIKGEVLDRPLPHVH